MYVLEVENTQGATLTLTQNESNFQIVKVTGLTPPKALISTSTVASMDGEKYKSSRLDVRNIVITVKLNGNVEQNRLTLYNFFDNGEYCKIHYFNGTRNVYCEGICENVDNDLFTSKQEMQISILCTEPYWKSLNLISVDLSQAFGMFEFPFAIDSEGIAFTDFISNREVVVINGGEVKCGILITLTATTNEIVNPIIYNVKTGESLKVNTTLNTSDVVIINTNRGQKSIKKIVDGNSSNIIGSLEAGSTWFQLDKGVNIYTCRADANSSGLKVHFEFRNLYKGV